MTADASPPPTGFPLRRGGAIRLHPGGIGHLRSMAFGGELFTPWEAVTHLTVGPGGMRLGTLHGSFLLRSAEFTRNGDHRTLAAEIRARVGALPDGAERLARMAELDALARSRRRTPVSAAIAAVCVALHLVSRFAPEYHEAGVYSGLLVGIGETWRLVIANFLHAGAWHLGINSLGLLVLGGLLERSLGSRAAAAVMATSAIGSMAGCFLADYQRALGASGIVAGVAGALLWLELRSPASLAVGWRIPRRLFVALFALEAIALTGLANVAHAAHAGGLAGGVLGVVALAPGRRSALSGRAALRALNAAALAAVLLAGAAWVRSVRAPDPEALARRGEALLALPGVGPGYLNDEAWRIAISSAPSPRALEVALRMAERAVADTHRLQPAVLDTLAELHFLSGDTATAIAIGEEAAALAPREPYYREQIRRFSGERAADDRPEAPPEGGPDPAPLPPPDRRDPDEPGPGIRV